MRPRALFFFLDEDASRVLSPLLSPPRSETQTQRPPFSLVLYFVRSVSLGDLRFPNATSRCGKKEVGIVREQKLSTTDACHVSSAVSRLGNAARNGNDEHKTLAAFGNAKREPGAPRLVHEALTRLSGLSYTRLCVKCVLKVTLSRATTEKC